jgi:hypothetical protein
MRAPADIALYCDPEPLTVPLLVVGAGVVAWQAAPFAAAVGQSYLATHATAAAVVQTGGTIATVGSFGYTAYQASQGDPYAQTALANPGVYGVATLWNTLAEVGAAAFCPPFIRNSTIGSNGQFVTRWRGTDVTEDILAIERGVLESKAQRAGIPPSFWNRSVVARFWHSITSNQPPSQYVSLTRDPRVAQRFSRTVFEFEVRERELHRAWWNFFGEAEDLAPGGTHIYNVRRLK